MKGNDARVVLDLNYADFQAELFDLDTAELRKVFKTLKKLRALTWQDIFRDKGLRWEELIVHTERSKRLVTIRSSPHLKV
jgi:hypothetical protein